MAFADPTWDALYAKYENRKKAGYTWGLQHGFETIITGVSIILGGLIVSRFSFDALFLIMGTIQTIGTIYQARILKVRA